MAGGEGHAAFPKAAHTLAELPESGQARLPPSVAPGTAAVILAAALLPATASATPAPGEERPHHKLLLGESWSSAPGPSRTRSALGVVSTLVLKA